MAKTNQAAKLPVLDQHTKDADVIGYAATADQAAEILMSHFAEVGNGPSDIMTFKLEGVFNMKLRSLGYAGTPTYRNIDHADLENGFWDNA
jgi:hypothetical protein